MQDETNHSLEAMLGLDTCGEKLSSEEMFYFQLTQGGNSKLDMLLYQVDHILSTYKYLQEKNINITVTVFDGTSNKQKQLSQIDLLKFALEYSLYSLHGFKFTHSRVVDGDTYLPCDMPKMIELLLSHPETKKLAVKKYE